MPSKSTNAIILAIILPGVGHIYLGLSYRKIGIAYLVLDIAVVTVGVLFYGQLIEINRILISVVAWLIWGLQLAHLIQIIRGVKTPSFTEGWETKP